MNYLVVRQGTDGGESLFLENVGERLEVRGSDVVNDKTAHQAEAPAQLRHL